MFELSELEAQPLFHRTALSQNKILTVTHF